MSEAKPELTLNVHGDGPAKALALGVLQDPARAGLLVKGLLSVGRPLPPAVHVFFVDEPTWLEDVGGSEEGAVNARALGDDTVVFRRDYWDWKIAREDFMVQLEFEVSLFHEILHLLGFAHGEAMCAKVLAHLHRLERATAILAPDGERLSARPIFDFLRRMERRYHSNDRPDPEEWRAEYTRQLDRMARRLRRKGVPIGRVDNDTTRAP